MIISWRTLGAHQPGRTSRPALHVRGDRVQHDVIDRDKPPTRPGLERGQHLVLHLLDDNQAPGQEFHPRHGEPERFTPAETGVCGEPGFATARQKIQEQLVDGAHEAIAYFRYTRSGGRSASRTGRRPGSMPRE
jgi:hypothetical protein